jgi:hypothetical protein
MSGQNVSKREAVKTMLKKHPEWTNRAIAKAVEIEIGSQYASVSHPLVAAVRRELEKEGIIPHIDPTERVEANGRRARGRKPALGPGVMP